MLFLCYFYAIFVSVDFIFFKVMNLWILKFPIYFVHKLQKRGGGGRPQLQGSNPQTSDYKANDLPNELNSPHSLNT